MQGTYDAYLIKTLSCERVKKETRPKFSTFSTQIFRLEGLSIDFAARTVSIDGNRITLSPKEYDLLVYLVRNAGVALTREQLLSTVWGYDFYGDDRTLDTHVKLLRRDLGPYANHIVTVRGVGYRFEKESSGQN